MFRSGWVPLVPFVFACFAHASDFDYRHLSDAVEMCEGRLVPAKKPPVGDERLRDYVARLSSLRREAQFYLQVSTQSGETPFVHLMKRSYQRSEDLVHLTNAGLWVDASDGQLKIWRDGPPHVEALREPLWRLQFQPDGVRTGYLSLVGWSRVRHRRVENGVLQVIDELPPGYAADVPRGPAPADHVADEMVRLARHGLGPESASLLLEAMGELAEILVARAAAVCTGESGSGFLNGGEYPNSLLALAAYALKRDPVMRNMIAGALNEHVHGWLEVRATYDDEHVFRLKPACGSRAWTFSVPADPFRNPGGWGELR